MGRHVPLEALPEGFHAPFREYVDAMLADGWTLNHSTWYMDDGGKIHNRPGDRSIVLTRDDFVVWFVDRTNAATRWRPEPYDEHWTAAWYQNGQKAFELPKTYDWQAFVAVKGYCPECHRNVGADMLRPLGFAGKICVQCDNNNPGIRAQVEFPGWTN